MAKILRFWESWSKIGQFIKNGRNSANFENIGVLVFCKHLLFHSRIELENKDKLKTKENIFFLGVVLLSSIGQNRGGPRIFFKKFEILK
jgi:hypothetical protein